MYPSIIFSFLSALFIVTSVAAPVAQPSTSLGELVKKDAVARGNNGYDIVAVPNMSNDL
jgi:hypothetical protein